MTLLPRPALKNVDGDLEVGIDVFDAQFVLSLPP
jgi:hypothetical protein